MKFLIDEDLPRSAVQLFQRYGYEAFDVRETGLRGKTDYQIASFAQSKGMCIVTGDYDFSNIRNYPPEQYRGIVVFNIPKDASAAFILNLIENFIKQPSLIEKLSGKLAIVEPDQIRIRRD